MARKADKSAPMDVRVIVLNSIIGSNGLEEYKKKCRPSLYGGRAKRGEIV